MFFNGTVVAVESMLCLKSSISHQSCFSFRFLRLGSISNLWLFCSRVSVLKIEHCSKKKKQTNKKLKEKTRKKRPILDHHLKWYNGKSKTGLSSPFVLVLFIFSNGFQFNYLSSFYTILFFELCFMIIFLNFCLFYFCLCFTCWFLNLFIFILCW